MVPPQLVKSISSSTSTGLEFRYIGFAVDEGRMVQRVSCCMIWGDDSHGEGEWPSTMFNRRSLLSLPLAMVTGALDWRICMAAGTNVIDDLSEPPPRSSNGASWQLITDGVMGGVSSGTMQREEVQGRKAIRMQGDVRLENNGGFIQIALDLAPGGIPVDASDWSGLEIGLIGNGESYNLHLRTADGMRPWQSYRQAFVVPQTWQTYRLPFAQFEAYRIDAKLDLTLLRRIGIVAIGRAFHADIAIGGVRFFA